MKMLKPHEKKMKLKLLDELKRELSQDLDLEDEMMPEDEMAVSVMAETPEDLEEGLETAKELVGEMPDLDLEDDEEDDDEDMDLESLSREELLELVKKMK